MTENSRPDPENPSFEAENAPKIGSTIPQNQSIHAPAAPEIVASKKSKVDPTDTPGWERNTLEKLAFASLNEQKATRRWKAFVRMSWLLFFWASGNADDALTWLAVSLSPAATGA